MQIYRELKVITARPTNIDIKLIKHHLYGYVSGSERYNVEKWCNDAKNIIESLFKNNVTPIFVGGTGLYIDTLINGITSIPSMPESIKKESNNLFDKIGLDNFFELIKEIDINAVNNISKNDTQRLKRIWEVYKFTGKKFSLWKDNKNKKFLDNIEYKIILFLPDRTKNYNRVNKRVESMIENGAVHEIENLLKYNYSSKLPIMRAHGVPEISSYLQKKVTLEECINNIQLVTRHYVKRQNTWWKSSNLQFYKKFNEFPDEIDINSNNLV